MYFVEWITQDDRRFRSPMFESMDDAINYADSLHDRGIHNAMVYSMD